MGARQAAYSLKVIMQNDHALNLLGKTQYIYTGVIIFGVLYDSKSQKMQSFHK